MGEVLHYTPYRGGMQGIEIETLKHSKFCPENTVLSYNMNIAKTSKMSREIGVKWREHPLPVFNAVISHSFLTKKRNFSHYTHNFFSIFLLLVYMGILWSNKKTFT